MGHIIRMTILDFQKPVTFLQNF